MMLLGLLAALIIAGIVLLPGQAFGYRKIDGKWQKVVVELEPILTRTDAKGEYTLFLERRAAQSWKEMVTAAEREGVHLRPSDGRRVAFRTDEMQAELKRERPAFAANPGESNHQGGIALDVDTDNGTNAAFKWLTANAHSYGWRRTVSYEPWHWEYRP